LLLEVLTEPDIEVNAGCAMERWLWARSICLFVIPICTSDNCRSNMASTLKGMSFLSYVGLRVSASGLSRPVQGLGVL
jgi:hypothetical protein